MSTITDSVDYNEHNEPPIKQKRYRHDKPNDHMTIDVERQVGATTSRGPVTKLSRSTTPRDAAPAATARAYTGASMEFSNDPDAKGNMNDMRQKLQSIQTGKAYLEKKIQEYESRLNQMKVKKDRHGK